jgi:hypothetical protein
VVRTLVNETRGAGARRPVGRPQRARSGAGVGCVLHRLTTGERESKKMVLEVSSEGEACSAHLARDN